MTASFMVRGATVISVDPDIGTFVGDVLVQDGVIAATGPHLREPVDEVVDGTGKILLPGFVDSHRHMYSGLLRGCGDGVAYDEYFTRVVLGYGGAFEPEDSGISARLGLAEAVDSGITTLHAWEHNLHTPQHAAASLSALEESGLRGRFSYGPPNTPMSINLDDVAAFQDDFFPLRKDGRSYGPSGRVHLGIASRGVELSKPDIWMPEFEFARVHGLPYTGHLEVADAVDSLDDRGFLGPDLLAVHATHSSDAQLARLAETGTPLCVALPATGRAADGKTRLSECMAAGILICLSIDSLAGCDTSDYFTMMRMTLVIERIIHQDPLAYPVERVIEQATINGAKALGLDAITGSITPGKRADLTLMRGFDLNMAPLNNPTKQVVLSGQPRNVEWVWVDGVALKADGRLTRVDERELVLAARERVAKLAGRTGIAVR